jgi:hypothetical protein
MWAKLEEKEKALQKVRNGVRLLVPLPHPQALFTHHLFPVHPAKHHDSVAGANDRRDDTIAKRTQG